MSAVAEETRSETANHRKPVQQKDLVLRCMVFRRRKNEYTAECIDLDITARGDSPHAALQALKAAVTGYLKVVFNGDTAGLVPRPSPLSHRVRYHLFALRAALGVGHLRRNFLVSDWSPGPCTS